MTEPRVTVHRRVGGVTLRVPFEVDGKSHFVELGIQVTSLPVDLFDGPTPAFRFRNAMVKALTAKIPVKYEKGLVENHQLTDVLTDVAIAHSRNTM